MANEITLTAALSVIKSGVNLSGTVSGKAITQAGANNLGNVQAIGTSSEILTFGDVASIGYLYVQNLDATNFVSVGTTNPAVAATCQVTLKGGEAALIPTRLQSWYAIADTATVNLYVLALDL